MRAQGAPEHIVQVMPAYVVAATMNFSGGGFSPKQTS